MFDVDIFAFVCIDSSTFIATLSTLRFILNHYLQANPFKHGFVVYIIFIFYHFIHIANMTYLVMFAPYFLVCSSRMLNYPFAGPIVN